MALLMVIELNLPAPLCVIRRVPPQQQLSGLASRQQHQSANVLVRQPDILALDGIATSREARDRRIIRLLEVVALLQHPAIAAARGDGEDRRRGMHQHDVDALHATTCKRDARCGGFGIPEIPILCLPVRSFQNRFRRFAPPEVEIEP